jgi:DNA-binding NarL/FixJ family response regulator
VLRILLVEDNAQIAEELSSALEELAPAKVVATAQAQDEACHWMDVRTQACDVAVIDVFLKRGSGLGVLEHIAKYERPPRRVILTNYATPDMHHRCLKLGAEAVFDKSTEIEQLVSWLAETEVGH